jgi:drug/metabolite transporter (DMT)-like permease
MTARDLAMLLLVAALMAASFLFMKVAAPAFGAALLGDLRVLLAAAMLLAWHRLRGRRPQFVRGLPPYLLLGLLNAAVPFTLVAWSELHVPASLAAVTMATIPLFTAAFAAATGSERLDGRRWLGLAVGFAGVGVLSGWHVLGSDPVAFVAIGALLVSAACYALGSIHARRSFVGVDATSLTAGNFLAAGALLAPFAVAAAPSAHPTPLAVAALAGLVVLSTAAAYRLYFDLIASAGPTIATSIGFLVPVFAAVWAFLILNEPLGPATLVGGGLVLAAVRLVAAHGVSAGRLSTGRCPTNALERRDGAAALH